MKLTFIKLFGKDWNWKWMFLKIFRTSRNLHN